MPNGYLDILYLDIDFIVSKIDFLLCLKAYAFSALFLLESNIAKSELNVFKLAKEHYTDLLVNVVCTEGLYLTVTSTKYGLK